MISDKSMTKLLSILISIIVALFSATNDTPHSESLPHTTYIVNINTDKFHTTTCTHTKSIKEQNRREYTGEKDLLIDLGFAPCKECNP